MSFFIQLTLLSSLSIFIVKFFNRIAYNHKQKIILLCFILTLFLPIMSVTTYPIKVLKQTQFDEVWIQTQQSSDKKNIELVDKKTSYSQQKLRQFDNKEDIDINFNMILIFIWIVGVLTRLLLVIIKNIKVVKLIKQAENFNHAPFDQIYKKNVHVKIHNSSAVPFLYVLKEIYIILPQHVDQWSEQDLRHVIDHELCHYVRKDHWSMWLSLLVSIVYWFHPLMRYLVKQHKYFMELSCDQQLIHDGVNKYLYAETLVDVTCHTRNPNPLAVEMAQEPNLLRSRIEAILHSEIHTFDQKIKVAFLAVLLCLTGCIDISKVEALADDEVFTFISHDLPKFRADQLSKGQLQVSAFYDGKDNGNTYLHIELVKEENNKWLKLGPLHKFNQYIHTWHFSLADEVEVSGQYKISGAEADGVIDGVAVGLIAHNHTDSISILKSHSAITNKIPNVVCSWPLWLKEHQIIRATPQLSDSKPESVERLLCGAQLMANGHHSFH